MFSDVLGKSMGSIVKESSEVGVVVAISESIVSEVVVVVNEINPSTVVWVTGGILPVFY